MEVVGAGSVPVEAVKHQRLEPFLLIAGDISGTKTLLALYDPGERAGTLVLQIEYRTANYKALDAMVRGSWRPCVAQCGRPASM